MYQNYYMFGDKNNTCVMLKKLKTLKSKSYNSLSIKLKLKNKSEIILNYTDMGDFSNEKLQKDIQFLNSLKEENTIFSIFILLIIAMILAALGHTLLYYFIKFLYSL